MKRAIVLLCCVTPFTNGQLLSGAETGDSHTTVQQVESSRTRTASDNDIGDLVIGRILKRFSPRSHILFKVLSPVQIADDTQNPEFVRKQLVSEEASLVELRHQISQMRIDYESKMEQYQQAADEEHKRLSDEIKSANEHRQESPPLAKSQLASAVTPHDRLLLKLAEQRLQRLAFYTGCPHGFSFEECSHDKEKAEWLNERRTAENEIRDRRADIDRRTQQRSRVVEEQTLGDAIDAIKFRALTMRVETYQAKVRMRNRDLDRDRLRIRDEERRLTIREREVGRLRSLLILELSTHGSGVNP